MVAYAGARGRGIPWRILGWGGVALLLLLPYVANAPWTASDYVFMGLLLGIIGLGVELTFHRFTSLASRLGAAIALLATFFLIWINAAVGIIGSEAEQANALFLLPIGTALLGSLLALFRPRGMAWAMALAALAQAMVPVIASAMRMGPASMIWDIRVVMLTFFFTGAWLVAAALLRRAVAEPGNDAA